MACQELVHPDETAWMIRITARKARTILTNANVGWRERADAARKVDVYSNRQYSLAQQQRHADLRDGHP